MVCTSHSIDALKGLAKALPCSKSERRFAVATSAHGLAFVEPSPEAYILTLEEAEWEARFWVIHADTVGGAAEVREKNIKYNL